MVYYCTTADVGSRLGLDSGQRTRASTRLTAVIRRATIVIDQIIKEYGRDEPRRETAETTLDGAHAAGTTTIDLASGGAFGVPGDGNVDGDSFSWTGRSGNQLTGVVGLSFDHAGGVAVQQGTFAHVIREICADLAASLYLEDEGTHQTTQDGGLRGQTLHERAMTDLQRLAHLGDV